MMEFLKANLYWIVPLGVTVILSILNMRLVSANTKVAESQRKLQNNEFCYQLYERRMTVYTQINQVLAEIGTEGAAREENITEFSKCTRDVPFLFGPDIVELTKQLRELICRLRRYSVLVERDIKRQEISKSHTENSKMQSELVNQITDLQLELPDYFKPYINFGEFKVEAMNEVKKCRQK